MTDADAKRALIEQAHQLNELTKHPGWKVFVDYANNVIMRPAKMRVLNDTNIVELADYKRTAGFLIGMTRALEIPKEVQELAANSRRREAEAHEDDAA